MNMSILSKPRIALVASLLSVAPIVQAAVVCPTLATPIVVPQNIDGVYVNLMTGANGTSGGAVAGWDFDPYGTTDLLFYWPSTAPRGGLSSDGTTYAVLNSGDSIGPAGTYIALTAATATATWRAGATGKYLGVQFLNEGTATVNYGWVQLDTTGATGHPAQIVAICYENTGAAITAGDVPVELQSFTIE